MRGNIVKKQIPWSSRRDAQTRSSGNARALPSKPGRTVPQGHKSGLQCRSNHPPWPRMIRPNLPADLPWSRGTIPAFKNSSCSNEPLQFSGNLQLTIDNAAQCSAPPTRLQFVQRSSPKNCRGADIFILGIRSSGPLTFQPQNLLARPPRPRMFPASVLSGTGPPGESGSYSFSPQGRESAGRWQS